MHETFPLQRPYLADGYHPLAPGKIATVLTYLEMTSPPEKPLVEVPAGYSLVRIEGWNTEDFLNLYNEIGWEWLWSFRLLMQRDILEEHINHPAVLTFVPLENGRRMGLLEMDFRHQHNVEISLFGLIPGAVRKGVGRWLMQEAIHMAFRAKETKRLWLHTCHFDSPQALPFYMRMGFVPYARSVEVFDDARLLGFLDEGAGPRVPLIKNARYPDGV